MPGSSEGQRNVLFLGVFSQHRRTAPLGQARSPQPAMGALVCEDQGQPAACSPASLTRSGGFRGGGGGWGCGEGIPTLNRKLTRQGAVAYDLEKKHKRYLARDLCCGPDWGWVGVYVCVR
ncbi:unnamed protein product [Rangifer tarandus platyrhynchus]|uniref:Uncharacterized protein n=1 Tax=Rangifer tarandus platyrhynchus TaxID=3082113 RepID=A0AC59Z931_RANTA